jgi:hypothetical protein
VASFYFTPEKKFNGKFRIFRELAKNLYLESHYSEEEKNHFQ